MLCWFVAPLLVGFAALVRGPPHGRACCVGACPPPTVGRAVSVCGPSHGEACCAGLGPASWSAVLRCCVTLPCRGRLSWCVPPLMVGSALLLPVCRGGCAWCGGAWLGLLSCGMPGGRSRWVWFGGACGGVVAGTMRGLFCLFGVVFAALRSTCSGGCGRRFGCGCGCVDRLAGVDSVLVRAPPHGAACCAGAWPPSWWGVLCCCLSAGWLCDVWWCLAWVVVTCPAWRPALLGSGWWCLLLGFVCSVLSSPPYGRHVRVAVVGG